LSLEVWPETTCTVDGGTSRVAASRRSRAAFALPSTGGALTQARTTGMLRRHVEARDRVTAATRRQHDRQASHAAPTSMWLAQRMTSMARFAVLWGASTGS
jgi:hypothetical protein